MRSIRKLLCLLITLITMLLCGCSSYSPIKSSDEDLKVVGQVGEFDVLYEEFRFAVLTYKQVLMDTYGEDIFDTEESAARYSDMIWDYVCENITVNYAIITMCREVQIEADDEVLLEAVQKEIEQTIDSLGGRRKYKKYLQDNYMTDHFLRFNTCVDLMQNELFYVYIDDLLIIEDNDEKIFDIIGEEFVRTQHIYISKKNGSSDSENRASIEEAYAKLDEGEDFYELVKLYGEDSDMNENGLYLPRGYMSEDYENVAFSLDVNEHSNIIESSGGYYIIKRLEQDTLYVMSNFDILKDRYQKYKLLEMINKTQGYLEFVPNDYLKSLDILKIK